MRLENLHQIPMITGNAPRNIDLYAGVLGPRLVKKRKNFDQSSAYHLVNPRTARRQRAAA